ncbi:trehalase-like [Euwallacea similis]|uniref:trehalase-like n=1 Tax=Euwallacea similis TaxID=1736056 RepID=UPI00344E0F80
MNKLCGSYFFLPLLFSPVFLARIKRDVAVTDPKQSCDSKVYCQGLLLDTVQRARLYNDSKTFVDMSQVNNEDVTLRNFDNLLLATNNSPTRKDIQNFVKENFNDNDELQDWEPEDFNPNPEFLDRIESKEIRQFAADVVNIWLSLGRKIADSVFENPNRHSLIAVPNGFIIPGGRFREFYYWDTYWILEGLIISDMVDTAKGMLQNFLSIVNKYGFIPNGGRVYYLNRSQPPLLTLMAGLLYDKTRDVAWILEIVDLLDTELTYWVQNKTIDITINQKTYKMAHYISESVTPRPESYIEDVTTCSYFETKEQMEHCYQGLKSGAESGWDFSSRWFFDEDGGVKTNLTHIDTQRVIPVDLNSFLCAAFKRLSSFYKLTGNLEKSLKWKNHAHEWESAIQEVLYDEKDGIWYDFDAVLSKPRKMFFPSNFSPLWANAYNQNLKEQYGKRAANYFKATGIGQYRGGTPTSLDDNNEQWDLPNAWPPLQEIVILGLWNTGNRKAKDIAKKSAERWIEANMVGFQEQSAMFEKYDATRVGQYGGGGEYQVQKGFGWTNGVALNLINKFFTKKTSDNNNHIEE